MHRKGGMLSLGKRVEPRRREPGLEEPLCLLSQSDMLGPRLEVRPHGASSFTALHGRRGLCRFRSVVQVPSPVGGSKGSKRRARAPQRVQVKRKVQVNAP